MKLKIIWMYHDLMDLYGDKGNIQVLKLRCQKRGIECQVDTCTIGEKVDFNEYDLFFLGGGADREQALIFEDLITRKNEIKTAMNRGMKCLLICGGYQLFGKYYKDQDGKQIDGLGIFDYYTVAADRNHRCIGNIAIEITINGESFQAVGFENHGGQTYDVLNPLGRVLKGHGNYHQSAFEGFLDDTVLATYMHGPLLPKNPKIADYIIKNALKRNCGNIQLEPLDDTLEIKAQEVMLKRLNISKVNQEKVSK